jgi:hypothetical protein
MNRRRGILILIAFSLVLGFPAAAGTVGPKIYWHFTFKAFVDVPSTTAVEWVWVTMLEYDKAQANPMADETIREFGGTLRGTVFAFIRGAAWRSAHRYEVDDICRGRKDKRYISWDASESDSVFCGGQFFDARPYTDRTGAILYSPKQFRLVFTTRSILHEDGTWEDLKNQARVFVGAINVEGRPRENTKGSFHLQVVNYLDCLKHYRTCSNAWVEQYDTAFRHFSHDGLEDDVPEVGQYGFGQVPFGFKDKNNIVWEVHRSTSREHPHWKQQTM